MLFNPKATHIVNHRREETMSAAQKRHDDLIGMARVARGGVWCRSGGFATLSLTRCAPVSPMTSLFLHRLFLPVDAAALACFRIAFGGLVLWGLWDFQHAGLIEASYVVPRFHFTYYGWDWVRPWPGAAMYVHFYGLMALAACVMLGLAYRITAGLLFAGYAYLFLIEKTFYLNHEYLICLVALLMVCVPAQRAWSLDALRPPGFAGATAPAWSLWLLRFQFAVPYVFGGLAKLDADWLSMAPVRLGLAERRGLPLVGEYVGADWVAAAVTYGGLALDLAIVPLLLWRRTRPAAFVLAVLFHASNAVLFNIGVFPWLMIAGTTLFLSPDWPRRLFGTARAPRPDSAADLGHSAGNPAARLSARQGLVVGALATYVTVQVLFPLRQHLYPGNPSWTEQGHRFAWRMMLVHKRGYAWLYAVDPQTQEAVPVDVRPLLTPWQLRHFAHDPDMVVQLAHRVAAQLQASGYGERQVRAVALVSLNGRKPQVLIDPHIDLATTPRTLRAAPWIVPLTETLPERPWDAPVSEWRELIEVEGDPRE